MGLVDEQRSKLIGTPTPTNASNENTSLTTLEDLKHGQGPTGNPSASATSTHNNITERQEGVNDNSDSEQPEMDTTSHAKKNFMPITFVIGAVAHCDPASESGFGQDYLSDKISISPFGLSASCVCSKLCHEFEHLWNV